MSQVEVHSSSRNQQISQPRQKCDGILKFLTDKNSQKRPQGKKCHPHRQFGISSDSPVQFINKNTLICNMNRFKQLKANQMNKPQILSQKNFFSIQQGPIIQSSKTNNKNFINSYNNAIQQNKFAFHHKTSRISNFYDQNAWMGSRFFVMGHQRSEAALENANNDIKFSTRSARSLNLYKKRSMSSNTLRSTAGYQSHQDMKQFLMGQKSKIRTMRNSLANYYQPQSQPYPQQKRPKTSYNNKSTKLLKYNEETAKKTKQFQINLPQWGERDFNVNFIDWKPSRQTHHPYAS